MSPDERREARAALLIATARKVERAIPDAARIVDEALPAAEDISSRSPAPTRAVLAGGAIIHGFYNELEKVFRAVAGPLDGFEPRGEDWHAELMDQMFFDIPQARPAVLPEELRATLRECRKFRHLFRHLYAFDLDAAEVERLLRELPPLWERTRAALADFARVLAATGEALRESG